MACTNLLATSNAVKLDNVSFFSSSSDKSNHCFCLTRRLSKTTNRVQSSSSCFRETSLKAVTSLVRSETESDHGIGIVSFLRGKSYFVTGATGFLAKVLIEKLLRGSPEIGKIFLLMKSKDQELANKRLHDEIIRLDLFKLLKQIHGSVYEAFMKSKLIPVIGDIGEENLGIETETVEKISEEIDVIINCAARTTFDDRYDAALSVNALGPDRLLSLGKKCKKLKLFLHVSTAYVTGKKEGTILETPLNINSHLNIETELKLASEAARMFHGSKQLKKLKQLGLERAQSHGWENTYTFTKAIGECMIQSKRGDLPVVIIRPSVIESSYKEPFPGWLQGLRMSDPIIVAYGKGQISDFWGDDESLMDIIPVDMVANATIAAMAKHGCVSGLKVYNVTSSSHANPLRAGELLDFSHQYLCDSPLAETMIHLERMKLHSSLEEFTSSVFNTIVKREREVKTKGGGEAESYNTLSMKGKRMLKYFVSLARIYEPYTFFKARFDDTNTRSLIHEMSMQERKMFDFDVNGIDWEDYIVNVHLPGLKRALFRGRSS